MATDTARPRALPSNVLQGVDWETYLRLREHPANDHLRMSYLDGTLILVSPKYIHDRYGWRFALIVSECCEGFGIPSQGTVSSTLRRKGPGAGKGSAKEPDFGFYFAANEPRMRSKRTINLEVDPPPDLAIEVDHKSDSSKALALYARIGVPELWRYRVKTDEPWFGRLAGGVYESVDRSVGLPRLTPALVLSAMEQIDELGETAAKPWLRDWARGLPDPSA